MNTLTLNGEVLEKFFFEFRFFFNFKTLVFDLGDFATNIGHYEEIPVLFP